MIGRALNLYEEKEREIIMLSQKKYNRSRKDICIIIIIRSYSSRLNVVISVPGQTGFFSSADEFPFMRPDNRKWNVRVYITIGVSFNFISRRIDSNLALSTLSTRDNFR